MNQRLGEKIQGLFSLRDVLGEEALGTVYLAEGLRQRERYHFALLLLRHKLSPYDQSYFSVLSNLRRARLLRPAFWPTEAVMADDGTPGFAMEIPRDHERLRFYLAEGPMRAERALALCRALGEALVSAHRLGVVHGDLRPETVLIVRGARPGITLVWHSLHFLRGAVNVDSPADQLRYRPGSQVAGEGAPATPRTDVFALGSILYECLSGAPAFAGAQIEEVLERLSGPPPPLPAELGLDAQMRAHLDELIALACAPGEQDIAVDRWVRALPPAPIERYTERVPADMARQGWIVVPAAVADALDAKEKEEEIALSELDLTEILTLEPGLHERVTEILSTPRLHERITELLGGRVRNTEPTIHDRATEILPGRQRQDD